MFKWFHWVQNIEYNDVHMWFACTGFQMNYEGPFNILRIFWLYEVWVLVDLRFYESWLAFVRFVARYVSLLRSVNPYSHLHLRSIRLLSEGLISEVNPAFKGTPDHLCDTWEGFFATNFGVYAPYHNFWTWGTLGTGYWKDFQW